MSKDWHNAFAGTLLLFLIIGAIFFSQFPACGYVGCGYQEREGRR